MGELTWIEAPRTFWGIPIISRMADRSWDSSLFDVSIHRPNLNFDTYIESHLNISSFSFVASMPKQLRHSLTVSLVLTSNSFVASLKRSSNRIGNAPLWFTNLGPMYKQVNIDIERKEIIIPTIRAYDISHPHILDLTHSANVLHRIRKPRCKASLICNHQLALTVSRPRSSVGFADAEPDRLLAKDMLVVFQGENGLRRWETFALQMRTTSTSGASIALRQRRLSSVGHWMLPFWRSRRVHRVRHCRDK